MKCHLYVYALWGSFKKSIMPLSEIFYNWGRCLGLVFLRCIFIFAILDFALPLWAQPEANHSLTVALDYWTMSVVCWICSSGSVILRVGSMHHTLSDIVFWSFEIYIIHSLWVDQNTYNFFGYCIFLQEVNLLKYTSTYIKTFMHCYSSEPSRENLSSEIVLVF